MNINGTDYKSYRGMGSLKSMNKKHGSNDRYFQSDEKGSIVGKHSNDKSQSINANKFVPEGVEGMVKIKGSVEDVLH